MPTESVMKFQIVNPFWVVYSCICKPYVRTFMLYAAALIWQENVYSTTIIYSEKASLV